ncbi:MAG TPA: hypothetical protein VFA23_12965 [Dongiaceae bacterium]|nr:hypothetical protein [Dongiaceae bacterium]
MRKYLKAACLAGILALALAAGPWRLRAAEPDSLLPEGQAMVTDLGTNASVVTYWVSQSDGWHVVTTVDIVFGPDSDAEKHAIVRFSAVLLPGQSQVISVPVAIGEQQKVLRIRRIGDRIEVVRVPGPSA